METRKIRVLRSFFYNQTAQKKGTILAMTPTQAAGFVSANQAEYVKDPPEPPPPSPIGEAASPAVSQQTAKKVEPANPAVPDEIAKPKKK